MIPEHYRYQSRPARVRGAPNVNRVLWTCGRIQKLSAMIDAARVRIGQCACPEPTNEKPLYPNRLGMWLDARGAWKRMVRTKRLAILTCLKCEKEIPPNKSRKTRPDLKVERENEPWG